MTNISVYDDTAETLEQIAERHDTTIAELIDQLVNEFEDED